MKPNNTCGFGYWTSHSNACNLILWAWRDKKMRYGGVYLYKPISPWRYKLLSFKGNLFAYQARNFKLKPLWRIPFHIQNFFHQNMSCPTKIHKLLLHFNVGQFLIWQAYSHVLSFCPTKVTTTVFIRDTEQANLLGAVRENLRFMWHGSMAQVEFWQYL